MLTTDVRAFLVAYGAVEGSSGFPCFVGHMPDDTDKCVGIFDSGGMPADTMARENRLVQIQTRIRVGRLDYAAAYAQWTTIFNLLQDAKEVSGSPLLLPRLVFLQAYMVSPVVFYDNNLRPNMTTNWRAMLRA